MKSEASQVFFSKNTFVAVPRAGFNYTHETPNNMELEMFLRHIGNSAIKNLKRLEVVLPECGTSFLGEDKQGYQSWLRAIDLLEKSTDGASALTIAINYFGDYEEHS